MSDSAYLVLGTASMVLMMLTIIFFVYMFQRKLAQKAKAYRDIEKMVQQQELASAYSLIEGQEQERKRIASELHDNIGGIMASLKIYSDLSLEKEDKEEVRRLNKKINTITENLGQEIRKLSHKLDLRTLFGFGLKPALQQLCEAIADSGKLKITHVLELREPLSEILSFNLYRIIQELFTNTLKHAQATQVRLEITMIEQEIIVIYEDNGTGFDQTNMMIQGMGTKNINSRVSIIKGKLTLDASEKGTTYIIELMNYD